MTPIIRETGTRSSVPLGIKLAISMIVGIIALPIRVFIDSYRLIKNGTAIIRFSAKSAFGAL